MAKAKTLKSLKVKVTKPKKFKPFKAAKMPKSRAPKPYKAPVAKPHKPTKAEEPTTVKEVLTQIKADMPPTGAKNRPPAFRGGGSATGGRGHKKTAKTQEQIQKEVDAYGEDK